MGESGQMAGEQDIDRSTDGGADPTQRLNWALSAIRRVSGAVARATSESELVQAVCQGVIGDVFVLCWIGMPGNDAGHSIAVVAAAGRTGWLDGLPITHDDRPSGMGPAARAIRLCQTQVADADPGDAEPLPWQERARAEGIRCVVSVPLIGNGQAIGALTVGADRADAFGPEEIRVFEDLARDTVSGLEACFALAVVRNSEQRWRSLFDHMLDGFAYCVMHYENDVPVDYTHLLVNPAFERLTGLTDVVGRRVSEAIPGLFQSNPDLLHIYGRVARTGVPERFETYVDALGMWFSASVFSDEPNHFTVVFDNITERKKAESQASFLAHHDPLTGLPNRPAARDRFEQAMALAERDGTRIAVLLLDVDDFKSINDSLGHSVGDMLLRGVAERLSRRVRSADTVSRQGGDEFLILAPAIHELPDAVALTADILDTMAQPFPVGDRVLFSSVSLGGAVFPEDGRDFDTLLRKADMAMYQAKAAGKNSCRFFDPHMHADAEQRLALRDQLRRGLEREELVLHYQPQIDLRDGRVVGAEALVRWRHPELGLVAPARFIPIAEESGLIVPLGDWVLGEACRQTAEWRRSGLRDFAIAVNLSAAQFRRGHLENSVPAALKAADLEPEFLELELTESILIGDTETVLSAIQRLKALGVRLSIDDFGTGYSSLAYLKRFAVNKLKIDQSFVRGLETDSGNGAIVRAIVEIARSLGLRTIAEGIEDEPTLELLRRFGCDEAQGYHIAKPLPADAFAAFIDSRR